MVVSPAGSAYTSRLIPQSADCIHIPVQRPCIHPIRPDAGRFQRDRTGVSGAYQTGEKGGEIHRSFPGMRDRIQPVPFLITARVIPDVDMPDLSRTKQPALQKRGQFPVKLRRAGIQRDSKPGIPGGERLQMPQRTAVDAHTIFHSRNQPVFFRNGQQHTTAVADRLHMRVGFRPSPDVADDLPRTNQTGEAAAFGKTAARLLRRPGGRIAHPVPNDLIGMDDRAVQAVFPVQRGNFIQTADPVFIQHDLQTVTAEVRRGLQRQTGIPAVHLSGEGSGGAIQRILHDHSSIQNNSRKPIRPPAIIFTSVRKEKQPVKKLYSVRLRYPRRSRGFPPRRKHGRRTHSARAGHSSSDPRISPGSFFMIRRPKPKISLPYT